MLHKFREAFSPKASTVRILEFQLAVVTSHHSLLVLVPRLECMLRRMILATCFVGRPWPPSRDNLHHNLVYRVCIHIAKISPSMAPQYMTLDSSLHSARPVNPTSLSRVKVLFMIFPNHNYLQYSLSDNFLTPTSLPQ